MENHTADATSVRPQGSWHAAPPIHCFPCAAHRRASAVGSLAASLLLLCHALPARAFDTGHHSDLTREVLQDHGFNETAIKIVQVQNWLVDYYSVSPTSTIKKDLEKLHCDNLFSTEKIRNYWGWLAVNTRKAIQEAVREKDTRKALTILGISLHAVQDFYAHSNWAETHPPRGDSFRTETWFSAPPAAGDPPLYTGAYPEMQPGATELHGTYDKGLNKDSYGRPRWEQAYVFAYVASQQWIRAAKEWAAEIDTQFWDRLRAVSVEEREAKALDFDQEAAYRISEWIDLAGQDGHWKGKGSGTNREFAPFAIRWTASPDSPFVREFKVRAIHRLISDGLTGDNPPTSPVPAVPVIQVNRRAVLVRTLQVQEKEDLGFTELRIDSPGGRADFYARITLAGQTFIEAMQIDKRNVSPAWTTIKFVPASATTISIRYEMWDEDGGTRGEDDHCDIHPAKGKRDLQFTCAIETRLCSGDVEGVHDTEATAFSSSGMKPDTDRAIVRFYVTTRPLTESGNAPARRSMTNDQRPTLFRWPFVVRRSSFVSEVVDDNRDE